MDRIMATVYVPGVTNRVLKTGPNSHVDIKGGAGFVVSERDLLALLKMDGIEISYNDEWEDFKGSHIAKIGGPEYVKATILQRTIKAPVEVAVESLIDYTARPQKEEEQEETPAPKAPRKSKGDNGGAVVGGGFGLHKEEEAVAEA